MRVRDYMVIVGHTPQELSEKVGHAMENGWQPHGNLVVSQSGALMQPIVMLSEGRVINLSSRRKKS
jgi:hypothetical protein